MASIDISTWGDFYLGGDEGIFDIVKGKRLTRINMNNGETNFIGSSAENNGVTNQIGNTENIHAGNLITVSYNGSVGEAFYQEDRFVASDDVNVLYPRFKLNKHIAWFICPIIRSVGKQYAFINKWKKEDMEKTQIKLPLDKDGNPNWSYMEEYIKRIDNIVIQSINQFVDFSTSQKGKIDISAWKSFRVGELFANIPKPYVYHVKDVTEDKNGIPYIVRSKFNNGTKYRVENKVGMKLNPAGVISFGAENPTFFYQYEEWCSGRDIYYIDTRNLSTHTCFFLISCLMFITYKYSYNYGLFPDLLKKEYIKLPTINGEPDWNYMNDFMLKEEIRTSQKLKNIMVLNN